jgi:hypothetical protein
MRIGFETLATLATASAGVSAGATVLAALGWQLSKWLRQRTTTVDLTVTKGLESHSISLTGLDSEEVRQLIDELREHATGEERELQQLSEELGELSENATGEQREQTEGKRSHAGLGNLGDLSALDVGLLQQYLPNLNFPASKDEVVSEVQNNDAPQEVVDQIRNANTDTFNNADEVLQTVRGQDAEDASPDD